MSKVLLEVPEGYKLKIRICKTDGVLKNNYQLMPQLEISTDENADYSFSGHEWESE